MDTTNTYHIPGLENFRMPDHARIWVFQAERFLTDDEAAQLQEAGDRFAGQWKAHGKELAAQFGVLGNLFAVMAIDEQLEGASGCSIDTFMRFIQDAEKALNIRFTDRLVFAFMHEGKLQTGTRAEAKTLAAAGILTLETGVFDNLVPDLGKLRREWLKPASALWIGKILGE